MFHWLWLPIDYSRRHWARMDLSKGQDWGHCDQAMHQRILWLVARFTTATFGPFSFRVQKCPRRSSLWLLILEFDDQTRRHDWFWCKNLLQWVDKYLLSIHEDENGQDGQEQLRSTLLLKKWVCQVKVRLKTMGRRRAKRCLRRWCRSLPRWSLKGPRKMGLYGAEDQSGLQGWFRRCFSRQRNWDDEANRWLANFIRRCKAENPQRFLR